MLFLWIIEQNSKLNSNDVKVEKSGIISKEQAEIIVLENADMEAKDISGLKTKIENYYGKDIYDIEFYADNKEYNYNVDMYGGEIWQWIMRLIKNIMPNYLENQ